MRLSIFRALGFALFAASSLAWAGEAKAVSRPDTNPDAASVAPDPVEEQYQRLLELDDEALEEVDRWIQEEQAQRSEGVGLADTTLKARILERFRPVRKAYDAFLQRHSDHARAHLAYGSFLSEIGEHGLAVEHMEKARTLEPDNPAAWNNLANYYGHRGPIRKSFEYYAKAIELNPQESVYYQNLAVCVYLFRPDAREFYELDEPEVFEKALSLYRKAMELDPDNFVLASDYASSFYGMRPMSGTDPQFRKSKTLELAHRAIPAWEEVLKLATDELQRQGTLIHLARNKLLAGRTADARLDLTSVTNDVYQSIKQRILKNIEKEESGGTTMDPVEPETSP